MTRKRILRRSLQLGLITLRGTLVRDDGTEVFRSRFTGMFGRREHAGNGAATG